MNAILSRVGKRRLFILTFVRRVLVALFVGLACPGLSAQIVTEFALPEGVQPVLIVTGPDGNLWFADRSPSRVGRLTVAGDVATFPSGVREGGDGYAPVSIVAGPDGNLWLTYLDLSDNGTIVQLGLSGEHKEFGGSGGPQRMTNGPDGNLWFTQVVNAIGRMTTAGQVRSFPIPEPGPIWDITTGSDGNLWFAYDGQNRRLGRITPAGVVTTFPIPLRPFRITRGPDGNLWLTGEDRIVRMSTAGAVTEFVIPGTASNLIAGPDGAIWFLYSAERSIGRITTAGVLLDPIPIPGLASDLTVGPDGNVWFTEPTGKIGRIELARAAAIDSRILPVVGSTIGAINSFFRTAVQLHNATAALMSGRIVLHTSGISGTDSDPAVGYVLAAGQTQSIADLLPAMGRSGLGTADIEVTAGAVPITTARVFNDWGAAGTAGFTEEPMRAEDALRAGERAVLILPEDLTRYRFNVGVRTLGEGAVATLTVRDASGAILATVPRTLPRTYHEQQSGTAFLGVSTLPAGGSVSVSVTDGAAIFYGATVDNTTGDPSLQIARTAP